MPIPPPPASTGKSTGATVLTQAAQMPPGSRIPLLLVGLIEP